MDLSANVNLGPVRLSKALRLAIVPHVHGRKIVTADADGYMEIVGWDFSTWIYRADCVNIEGG